MQSYRMWDQDAQLGSHIVCVLFFASKVQNERRLRRARLVTIESLSAYDPPPNVPLKSIFQQHEASLPRNSQYHGLEVSQGPLQISQHPPCHCLARKNVEVRVAEIVNARFGPH